LQNVYAKMHNVKSIHSQKKLVWNADVFPPYTSDQLILIMHEYQWLKNTNSSKILTTQKYWQSIANNELWILKTKKY